MLFMAFFGGAVSAQVPQRRAITIEPFLQEVILEPNDASKNFTVTVTNNTTSVFNFNALPVDFGSLSETGGIFFQGSESLKLANKYGLANWIELEKTNYSLQPGQKETINVRLMNRNDLSPGGHYGSIFLNTSSSSNPGSNVSFRQSISSLVLAIKRGGERYDMSLHGAKFNGGWFKPPTATTLRFRNDGNTHVVPRGTVIFKNRHGKEMARGIINENSSYLLPETYRQLPVELKQQRSYPFFLFNSYQAEVNYRYDGLDKIATRTYTVRWINMHFLFLMLAASAAAFYLYNNHQKIAKSLKSKLKS